MKTKIEAPKPYSSQKKRLQFLSCKQSGATEVTNQAY